MDDRVATALCVLGPLEVVREDEERVRLGSGQQRRLLAVLLVHANEVVSSDRLVDVLWGNDATVGATPTLQTLRARLQTLVSRLRGTLGDDRVETCPPGYRLRVASGEVDALRFEELVRVGLGASDGAETALRAFDEALALWRGSPYAEFASQEFAAAEVARLLELRARAIEERSAALLELGRAGEVIGDLEAEIAVQPLRERLQALLMLALAQSGRPVEALRAYEAFRRLLADEVGVVPSLELQELNDDIVRQHPDVGWSGSAPKRPRTADLPTGTVTFLFTDLEGSTRLWEEHPEAMREALARHDEILRDAIEVHDGRVVKTTGDGMHGVFTTARSALHAAVGAQRGLCAEKWGATGPLRVRIGLHTGEAEHRAGDYYGTAVNRAARLMSVGHGGQVLVSHATEQVLRDEASEDFRLVDLGEHQLRDLASAERVFQVVAPGLPREFGPLRALDTFATDVPLQNAGRTPVGTEPIRSLPPGLDQPTLARYVGRLSEREELMKAWKVAVAGGTKLGMVAGEPGVGKTRLVSEIARTVFDDGGVVLFGRCTEEALMPYQPFVEALRHYAAGSSTIELADEIRVGASQLARLVPDLGARLDVSDPDLRADSQSEQFLLFEAVGAWLDAIAARAAVLVVLDDLHWADSSTLQLIAFLARRHSGHHLLMLGTYRETDLARTHRLAEMLADLRGERLLERISLRGLDAEMVTQLIAALAGRAPSAEFGALVFAETEGNPFFVEEVFAHLLESGALSEEGDEWVLTRPCDQLGVPEGVREVVGRRLSRLGETANRALSVGAVVGRDFDLDVVAHVAELTTDELLDILDHCIAVRIVVEAAGVPGRFSFSHALIRQTLYEELSTTRRVMLHDRVGRAIETLRAGRLDDQLGALAHHFLEAAAVGGLTAAVDYATRAAQQAVARSAYAEAAEILGRARHTVERLTPDDDDTLAELWLGIGDAQWRNGPATAGADAFLEAANCARRVHAAGALARSAYGYEIATWVPSRPNQQSIALAEEALAALGDTEPVLRVQALSAIARELEFSEQTQRRREVVGEAMTLARQSADPMALVIAALAYANERHIAGDADEAAAVSREALHAAEQTGDGGYVGLALQSLVNNTLAVGNVDEYEEVLARHSQVAATLRIPAQLRWAATFRSGRLLMRGALAAAETALDDVLSLTDPTNPTQLAGYGSQLITLRFEQERAGEILDLVRDAVEQHPGIPAFRIALARSYLQLGEIEEARTHYQPFLTDITRTIPNDSNQAIAIAQLADICDTIDDDPTDDALTQWFSPRANQYILVGPALDCWGSAHRTLGILARVAGQLDDAETHLEHALIANQRLSSARWVTRTQYDLAHVLQQHDRPGDRDRAMNLVRAARPVAEQHELRHTLSLLDKLDLDGA